MGRTVAGLLLAVFLAACSPRVELLGSIAESDANEVIAALLDAGIDASKVPGKEGMVGVSIDKAQTARAVDTLRALGLPREQFAGMGQVFRKDGLISSPVEERARYLNALSQDLSATLSRIDGVLFARVHLVLPERGTAGERDLPSSAAVFIKHQADADLELLQPQVRRLVVNSIPGLSLDRVTVVLVPSVASPTTSARSAPPPMASVLGIPVEAASATRLAIVLGVLALLAVGGLALAGWLAWRAGLFARGRGGSEQPPAAS